MGWNRETLRLVLIGALGAVVATYAIRGIDWLAVRLPASVSTLVAACEWLAAWAWHTLQPGSFLLAVGLATLWSIRAPGRNVRPAAWEISKSIIGWAARILSRRHRDRWRSEWLGELEQLRDRPVASLLYAAGVARSSVRM